MYEAASVISEIPAYTSQNLCSLYLHVVVFAYNMTPPREENSSKDHMK